MSDFSRFPIINISYMNVSELLTSPVQFRMLNGEIGRDNKIINKQLNRPQLVLSGYKVFQNYKSIQIFGNTEIIYLNSLSAERRSEIYNYLLSFDIPCIIFADQLFPDEDFLALAAEQKIAVLTTDCNTSQLNIILSEYLDDKFAPQIAPHGSFVDVYGVGMMFVGKSGIGKSEIALDLVERGHRFIADDIVMLTKKFDSAIIGTGTNLVKHVMEIRGLGLIDLKQMFGIKSIRFQKRLEIVVELVQWDSKEAYDRTGLEEKFSSIMGVDVYTVTLPIFPGKNITVIAESIAIDYLLKTYGYNTGKIFTERLNQKIAERKESGLVEANNQTPSKLDNRYVSWFHFDRE